jgi:hypothetical protein
MASSSSENTLNMNTLVHMLHIKLTSTKYLVWKDQLLTILAFQDLLHHVDGSAVAPASEVTQHEKIVANPLYVSWIADDRRKVLILHASLSEEAFAEVLGLSDAR